MKQERAARTREALVQAAAEAFDRDGYDGTSLAPVSKAAGISVGALTFHFRSKEELADSVETRGEAVTRSAVQSVLGREQTALDSVVAITVELARLLEAEPTVRAAARLTRERARTTHRWTDAWYPEIEQLLGRTSEDKPVPGTAPGALLLLASHLVSGAEMYVRECGRAEQRPHASAAEQLARIWRLVLRGRSADPGQTLLRDHG